LEADNVQLVHEKREIHHKTTYLSRLAQEQQQELITAIADNNKIEKEKSQVEKALRESEAQILSLKKALPLTKSHGGDGSMNSSMLMLSN